MIKQERGAVLITTLWVISALMVISAIVIKNTNLELILMSNYTDEVYAYNMAKYGIYQVLDDIKDNSLQEGYKYYELDAGSCQVSIISEGGKININIYDEDLLGHIPGFNDEVINYIIQRREERIHDIRELNIVEDFYVDSGIKKLVTTHGRYNINLIDHHTFDKILLNAGVDEIKAMFIANELMDLSERIESEEDLYKYLPNMEPSIYELIKDEVSFEGTIDINSASEGVINAVGSALGIDLAFILERLEKEPFSDIEQLSSTSFHV